MQLTVQALASIAVLVRVTGADGSISGAAAGVTPIQKVIQMLTGMLSRAQQEKQAEQVQFAAYNQFCSDVTQDKTRAVQMADSAMTKLQANIQLATTTADTLQREVQDLESQVATWQGDQKASTKVRETERADYLTAHQDYSDTIEAITKASQMLKAQAVNTPQAPATAILQVTTLKKLPQDAKRVLLAFLAKAGQDSAATAVQVPQAYAYEFRSGSILDMLDQLKDKFTEERSALEKEELNSRHAYELLAEDLKQSIANAEASRTTKSQQRAKELQNVAQMQGDLGDATSTRTDDSKYLSDITATCNQKASDYQERQSLRADEISAITKAIEILSSNAVAGHATTYFPAWLQQRNSSSSVLLQLFRDAKSPNQVLAASYLNQRAGHLHSSVLSALAISIRDDPFAKVKKMIQDLINRLQDAAGEEAQHQSWCQAELAENQVVRSTRSTSVERLTSQIDGTRSTIAKLASDLVQLSTQLAQTDQASALSASMRTNESASNQQTVKDAQEAQTAVGQAVTVLKEFYAMAGQSTALLQGRLQQVPSSTQAPSQPVPPPIFGAAYQGLSAENGGVIAMLEVIQSDFARLESTTTAAEATAQNEYNIQMTASAVLKAQTQKDIEHKASLKQQAEQALVDLNNDLTSAQKELDAANAYYEKLKPSCLDSGSTFQERAQRRQEEIESLQEALRILNGEDIGIA